MVHTILATLNGGLRRALGSYVMNQCDNVEPLSNSENHSWVTKLFLALPQ